MNSMPLEDVELSEKPRRKVTIVWVSAVSMAAAYAIMVRVSGGHFLLKCDSIDQDIASVIALVDVACDRVKDEMKDKHFVWHCKLISSADAHVLFTVKLWGGLFRTVPVWCKVNIASVSLTSINPDIGKPCDLDNSGVIHKGVVGSNSLFYRVVFRAYQLIKLMGSKAWVIGLNWYALANTLQSNMHTIYTLCVSFKKTAYLPDGQATGLCSSLNLIKHMNNSSEYSLAT
ncbi:uncharacterized protein DEA37_0012784 [Paragonimus westermani]|uniref:Uncharacterized protein n=1 Tax=Paragonimus westermani TaxID=34504 RepID=A0A5J4NFG9_9TREM|nr:uncharacterized protein DEA37_0012784 [Paragonimus westermani]